MHAAAAIWMRCDDRLDRHPHRDRHGRRRCADRAAPKHGGAGPYMALRYADRLATPRRRAALPDALPALGGHGAGPFGGRHARCQAGAAYVRRRAGRPARGWPAARRRARSRSRRGPAPLSRAWPPADRGRWPDAARPDRPGPPCRIFALARAEGPGRAKSAQARRPGRAIHSHGTARKGRRGRAARPGRRCGRSGCRPCQRTLPALGRRPCAGPGAVRPALER